MFKYCSDFIFHSKSVILDYKYNTFISVRIYHRSPEDNIKSRIKCMRLYFNALTII